MSFNSAQQQHFSTPNKVKVVAGYALQQRLGSGSFAVVYKGVKLPQQQQQQQQNTNTADTVAIKAIARTSEKLTKKVLQNLEIEISILRTYRHHNIVCMHDVQKTERHFYLLLEFCAGGDVQGLIRSRKAGRLSEGLTRRLMRDLGAGLKFLWGQELIHRDIKPQNLLLTGTLPLDELNDPAKTPQLEQERQKINFPSAEFALKIADFGFARHLQSASLAETLCGSPIYMAPEILQHQRYDAKADLWSVGTVLFEMISGKPPFHGENHIDLLRNIQRKAVRLPADVRVSKECVNLLRLLLNRNPLSRAGFKEFFEACEAFVALGCNGVATQDPGTCKPPARDLGTIPENDGGLGLQDVSDSLMTVATNAPEHRPAPALTQAPSMVTPPFGPSPTPAVPTTLTRISLPPSRQQTHVLAPLVPSPPCTANLFPPAAMVDPPVLDLAAPQMAPVERHVQMVETTPRRTESNPGLHNSSGGDSFVMVEHGASTYKTTGATALVPTPPPGGDNYAQQQQQQQQTPPQQHRQEQTPSSGYFFGKSPVLSGRADYMVMKQTKGILSTSPGTGGALMNMLTGGRGRLANQKTDDKKLEARIYEATKMLATAEDIGRRAVSVAHLGDNRAYLAMKLIMMNESSSSLLSATPMEGIEEASRDHDSGAVTDDSSSTDVMAVTRRRRGSSSDRSMLDAKSEENDEMPFALHAESPPLLETSIPSRPSAAKTAGSNVSGGSSRQGQSVKPTPASIRSYFNDALSCYVKALGMLKGALGAAGKIKKEIESLLQDQRLTTSQQTSLQQMKNRIGVTSGWLSDQFRGVLERGDATNGEIAKFPSFGPEQPPSSTVCVEELIYNHSLACGREGAVKQLLGQHEAARSCYRSAGLLAETLLMEPRVEGDDRKTLESYVDGFAVRINELDETMLQQSRLSSAASSTTSRRGGGPSVVGLVGQALESSPRPNFV